MVIFCTEVKIQIKRRGKNGGAFPGSKKTACIVAVNACESAVAGLAAKCKKF